MLRVNAVEELPALVGAGALGASAGAGGVSRDVMGEPIDLTVPESAWAAAQLLEVAARWNGAFGPRPTAIAVQIVYNANSAAQTPSAKSGARALPSFCRRGRRVAGKRRRT